MSWSFPNKSDKIRAVQPKKMDRGLTFRIKVLFSENKGADQLRSNRVFGFSHVPKAGVLMTRLIENYLFKLKTGCSDADSLANLHHDWSRYF